MAWRPYENLIGGELDNRTPGRVTGWMHFFRLDQEPLKVTFDLEGDFHEDIRGKVIRLRNPAPSEHLDNGKGTYMRGFQPVQKGAAGDITAGLPLGPWTEDLARRFMAQNELVWKELGIGQFERARRREAFAESYRRHIEAGDLCYPYVEYPYVEWYAKNGRVVLELHPSQVEVIEEGAPIGEKSPEELLRDQKRRSEAFAGFMTGMVGEFSEENRRQGGDGNVTGIVVE
jgi:hypothetical protein